MTDHIDSSAQHGPRPRVLILCSFLPYPAHRGDPLRVLGLLTALRGTVDMTLFCLDDGGDVRGLERALPGVRVVVFSPQRRRFGIASDVLRLAASLVTGTPSWMLKLRSRSLARAAEAIRPDVDGVLAFGEAAAQYCHQLGHAWHWDKFNVQTISLQDEFAQLPWGGSKLKVAIDLQATLRYERRYAHDAGSVSVTNSAEADRFRQVFGRSALVLHSTVPIPRSVERRPEPGRVLWLGNLSYRSNRDGLFRFLQHGWPSIADRFTLRVVGSDMADEDRVLLSNMRGVQPVGFVEDLTLELASAQIGVVPLWSGGGTKMKTLTMMASGVPVVSTPSGAEGISRGADSISVAESPQALAAAIGRLPQASADIGESGRAIVIREFSADGMTVRNQIAALVLLIVGQVSTSNNSLSPAKDDSVS